MKHADHRSAQGDDLVEAVCEALFGGIAQSGHAIIEPAFEAVPDRQAGRQTGLDDPFAVIVAAGRFGKQEIDPRPGQCLGLFAQVGLGLGLGRLGAAARHVPAFHVRLLAQLEAEVGDRAGDQHRALAGRLVARVLGQHDGAQVELGGLITEAEGFEVVARRGVGVGGDDVDPGGDVVLVHAAHGEGMGIQRQGRPGEIGHGRPHGLKLGADGAVEDDDLAFGDAFLEICVVAHFLAFPVVCRGINIV